MGTTQTHASRMVTSKSSRTVAAKMGAGCDQQKSRTLNIKHLLMSKPLLKLIRRLGKSEVLKLVRNYDAQYETDICIFNLYPARKNVFTRLDGFYDHTVSSAEGSRVRMGKKENGYECKVDLKQMIVF